MPGEKERPRAGASIADHASPGEWAVAAVAALMVLALLGYLLRDALTRSPTPPDLTVRQDSVVEVGAGYLVVLSVANDGGGTAATVQVRGELTRGDTVVESSEATLDYVPIGARRGAGLQFVHDPEEFDLVIRVVGFEDP